MPLSLLAVSLGLPAIAAEPPAASVVTTLEGIEVIRMEPRWDAPAIGTIRAGQSVRIAQTAIVGDSADTCKGEWVAIEPRGYVCTGWRSVLGGQNELQARAAAQALPDRSSPTLFHVGVSMGTPRYLRIPTLLEQLETESNLDRLFGRRAASGAFAGALEPRVADGPPSALARYFNRPDRTLVAAQDAFAGMKIAWTREFYAARRTWLVTPDLELIPKDKVRVEPIPALRGVDLRSQGAALPLAFLWLEAAPKLRRAADGQLVSTDETWPRHGFVPVTEVIRKYKGQFYIQTRDGDYLRKDLASTIKPAARPRGVGPQDKWVDVRVTHGYLVAYEGDRPVFATAISGGADGLLANGRRRTKLGRYAVQVKALSLDMSGVEHGTRWRIEEVPWVAVYTGDYALHAAWWHDDFGRPKSHGCINLSPADARFLFEWLEPALPEGWYSVAAYGQTVKGTVIRVRP